VRRKTLYVIALLGVCVFAAFGVGCSRGDKTPTASPSAAASVTATNSPSRPTSSPSGTPSGTTTPPRRAGIPLDVDNIINVVLSGNLDELEKLTQVTAVPCGAQSGPGSLPACPAG
jgi:hypothetical protein